MWQCQHGCSGVGWMPSLDGKEVTYSLDLNEESFTEWNIYRDVEKVKG
jgi:hypothetical protein